VKPVKDLEPKEHIQQFCKQHIQNLWLLLKRQQETNSLSPALTDPTPAVYLLKDQIGLGSWSNMVNWSSSRHASFSRLVLRVSNCEYG